MEFNYCWAKKYIDAELKLNNVNVREWIDEECGLAWVETREIQIPKPKTVNKFIICLHEICHIVKLSEHNRMNVYEYEYDCEMWSMNKAKQFGLDTNEYESRARGYVTSCLARGYNRGLNLDRVDKKIIDWLNVDISKWKQYSNVKVVGKPYWEEWEVILM